MSVDRVFPCPVCEKGEVRFIPFVESNMELLRWGCDNTDCAQPFFEDRRWMDSYPLSLRPLDSDSVFHWDENRGQWVSPAEKV
jgi:hypothetical protein